MLNAPRLDAQEYYLCRKPEKAFNSCVFEKLVSPKRPSCNLSGQISGEADVSAAAVLPPFSELEEGDPRNARGTSADTREEGMLSPDPPPSPDAMHHRLTRAHPSTIVPLERQNKQRPIYKAIQK